MKRDFAHILTLTIATIIMMAKPCYAAEYNILIEDYDYTIEENKITTSQIQIGLNLNKLILKGDKANTNRIAYNNSQKLFKNPYIGNSLRKFITNKAKQINFDLRLGIDNSYNIEKTMIYYRHHF